MDSGSSKGFDFASDDILCSYEDYTNQENSNGTHSDSAIATNSSKEFNKSRMSRPSFPVSSYSPPDDSGNQDVVVAAVERSMKKHSENLMRFLEGLSSRLSQLELYCYNVDKSIGEMRSDLARDHGESETKLKFLEKHLQEVHRSVQIIRDKQELADTQKELAKLQLAHKESESQKTEEVSTPSSDKRNDNFPEGHNQQLALALPQLPAPPPAAHQPPMSQPQTYYLSPAPTPNHYLQQDPHYQTQVTQPPPPRSQLSQPPPPQYQQQWAQQMQPPPQPAVRPPSPAQVFPPYLSSQQVNSPAPENLPNSMPMPPYSGVPQPTYGRTNPGQPQPQPQPQPPLQHMKPGFGGQAADGYAASGNAYMMYESEGGRVVPQQHPTHSTHFPQPVYPPSQQQQSSGGSMMARPPQQFMRSHPYNELIDKLGSMGYRGEHVMGVIQRLEESGQTVDFNTVLDRLNAHPSGASQRGWSG
ncbi:hypothetical protein Lser_V15G16875 [Lactuca serriola]